jgi:hypothetical protein
MLGTDQLDDRALGASQELKLAVEGRTLSWGFSVRAESRARKARFASGDAHEPGAQIKSFRQQKGRALKADLPAKRN